MKKLMFALCACAGLIAAARTVDVYDVKVTTKCPVQKSGKSGVYRDMETLKWTGTLTVNWVESTNEICTVDLNLTNKKFGSFMLADVCGFDGSSDTMVAVGAKNETGCCYFDFPAVQNCNGSEIKLTLSGCGKFSKAKGSCGVCGFDGPCVYLTSCKGNVTGWYSCGCSNTSTYLVDSCGATDEEETEGRGCAFGSWQMKFNKKLSY